MIDLFHRKSSDGCERLAGIQKYQKIHCGPSRSQKTMEKTKAVHWGYRQQVQRNCSCELIGYGVWESRVLNSTVASSLETCVGGHEIIRQRVRKIISSRS